MKFKSMALLLCLCNSTFSTTPDISLGEPVYGGTGCPAGTAEIIKNADGEFIGIMFAAFSAEVYELDAKRLQRKTCSIAIPVDVPPGFSVAPNFTQFGGYYDVTMNNLARFDVESFFAGSQGFRFSKQFQNDDAHGSFLVKNTSPPSSLTWSPCGQDVILRMNMNLFASGRVLHGRSIISIDHIQPGGQDGEALLVRSCN